MMLVERREQQWRRQKPHIVTIAMRDTCMYDTHSNDQLLQVLRYLARINHIHHSKHIHF
jgi:hypothetical protein